MNLKKCALTLATMVALTTTAYAQPKFRTALTTTNICSQGTTFKLQIFVDDNDEDLDAAEFVIEHPAADFNLDGFDESPSSHDGEVIVDELDDDGDESRIQVRVVWGIGDDRDFQEGLLAELDFVTQRNITGTTRFQLENEELNTDEDNDKEVIVNTSATEPITCGATPTPTPTATPTATVTPTPSPTPSEGQTVYSTSFDGGANGWEVVDLAGGPFNLATFTTPEGAIALSANGSANCFGFWKSPRIAVVGGHRMVVRWVVRSSSADTLTPAFRLRATDGAFRYSQFIAIESPSGGVAPGTDEKAFEMVYDVPADASEMELAFDITSFTPTDDLNAVLELREVSVRRQ